MTDKILAGGIPTEPTSLSRTTVRPSEGTNITKQDFISHLMHNLDD